MYDTLKTTEQWATEMMPMHSRRLESFTTNS